LFENEKIIANPNIVLREEFKNYVFLYDPDTGDTFPINPAGAFIWEHLDGCHTIDKILEMMSIDFEDVPDSAVDHIRAFLKELLERGFIRE
jgi:SynChlorMet cassette protein ScmD